MSIWNRHIDSRNIQTRKTFTNVHKHCNPKKHEICSGTKLFITFLSLRFFDMRRERHNFFLGWLFHLTPPGAAPSPQTIGLASASSENRLPLSKSKSQLSRSEFQSQLAAFFQISKSLAFPGMTSFTSSGSISYLGFLLWHLWLSHPPLAHVNTCTQCVHPN